MKKIIKKIKTRQKQKQKQSVNVKVNIDQSKRSINKPSSKSNKPPPYIPIPPIMINPATQTSSQISPFSFSEIKDVIRNVMGEAINNKEPTVRFVGEEMKNPYDMKTPQQNTSSKLNESIERTADTTFGTSFLPSRILPTDYWIDVDAEKENIKQQNESLSAIFPKTPNDQTLSTKLNTDEFGTPDEFTLSSSKTNPIPSTLSKKELRRQQVRQNYEDRKQRKMETPFVPLNLNNRSQEQLIQQAEELELDIYNTNRKGKGTKRIKTKQQLIEEITEKLKTPVKTTPASEIFQYAR